MSKVIIIAPSPIEGSGGVARIYCFAQALVGKGYDCHLYVFDSNGASIEDLSRKALSYYKASGFHVHTSLSLLIENYDLGIATRWDTAAMLLKIKVRHRAYLVQDYEACFNPVGDGSIFAENSYMLGLHPLTYGRWLASKLARDFGNNPRYFDFASDIKTFQCKTSMEQRLLDRPSIAFVYQSDKTRRCPALGVEALGIVKHYRPDVVLNFVGSKTAPSFWYEFNNVGNLTASGLDALYNKSHVGLSLSSSNPSCNAFDMMASGLPSVDLYRENNLCDVPSQGVLLAYQSAESIAEAIIHLLDNPDELLTRSHAGVSFMASRSQRHEIESFLVAVDAILNGHVRADGSINCSSILYDQPPVVANANRNKFVDAYLRKQLELVLPNDTEKMEPDSFYYSTKVSYDRLVQEPKAEIVEVKGWPTNRYEQLTQRLVRRFGLDPRLSSELFDPGYYLAARPDVAAAGIDPFRHFILHGIREGEAPSPVFETEWYEALYPEAERGGLNAIEHYMVHGSALNQSPNSVFDAIWYLYRYPDVRASGMHPLLHYIRHGESEKRDPGSKFSTAWYLEAYPDVAVSGMSPLHHYLALGRKEGLQPVPSHILPPRQTWQSEGCSVGGETTSVFEWSVKPEDFEPATKRVECDILDVNQWEKQVSFDIWSTILHRRCHHDEIKLRSARFLLLNAWDDLRPALRSTVHLMSSRMRAENDSAPHGDYEYRFSDAIPGWLDNVLVLSCGPARRAELAKLLIAHELEVEADSVEVDNNVVKTIRELKRAPLFISDFYMESLFLERLMGRVGLGGKFIRGYSSCDLYINKRSGELFRHVMSDFGVSAKDLVHIGDNPISDVERPLSFGINAVHYVSKADEERNKWYTTAFDQFCGGDLTGHQRRMLALVKASVEVNSADFGTHKSQSALFEAGCQIGLLAFGYCLNVMQDAITRKAREVVFLAREGILFKQLYDLIAAQDPFNTPVPPSRLLFVSRRATFAASMRGYDNTELMRLWTMYWRQSPIAFASSLNLDLSKASDAARRVGIDPHEVVAMPWSDVGFQSFMNDPEFKSYAVDHLARQRNMLLRYLSQEINANQDEVLIVDIGWRGTIQDNIAHVLDKPVRGHYLALFGYLNPQSESSSKVAWLSDVNNPGNYSLPDQVAPIEMIFNGSGGSTIGYEQRDGRIEPIREVFEAEEAVVDGLAPCRAGMCDIVPKLARYVKLHGLMADDLLALSRKVASDLLATPPSAIADMFGRLEHNETFGVGAVEAMDELGFAEVSAMKPGAELHEALQTWLGTRWPDGMSRQSVVANWWGTAAFEARASAPVAISRAQSPAIVQAIGSRLAVYVPAPIDVSGGYRTIMSTVRALIDVGFNADIYVEALEGRGDLLDRYVGDIPATIVAGWSAQKMPTLSLATVAHSADYVARHTRAHHKAYLVQDDESIFHPLGDASIQAENSYCHGLHHLTIGSWLTHLIRHKYGVPAYPAGFGVDTGVYRPATDIVRERAICILYQPEKNRRASELALRAAEIVKRVMPLTKLYVYGSHQRPNLNCEHINLGVVDNLSELNALYNRCYAGLCLSVSNPSRIPFEMAAAGCRPIDIYRYNNLMDHISGVSILAFQSADSIAEALLNVLLEDGNVAADGLAKKMQPRTLTWESDAIVSNVLQILEGRPQGEEMPQVSYVDDPVLAAIDDTPAARMFCSRQRPNSTFF